MAREAKVLKVTLEALRCTRTAGEGDTLEIYGDLFARGVFLNEHGDPLVGFEQRLWHRAEDAELVIANGTEFPINASVEFAVFNNDFLWLGGRIVENDSGFNPDDVLGDKFERIRYDFIGDGIVEVLFTESGQDLFARFNVRVLRIDQHPEM